MQLAAFPLGGCTPRTIGHAHVPSTFAAVACHHAKATVSTGQRPVPIRCHSSSAAQTAQTAEVSNPTQSQPWRALTAGMVGLLEGELMRLPAPVLLALSQACASASVTLSSRQVYQLCSGWQQQLHHTSAQQCITLLTSMTRVLPPVSTVHVSSTGPSHADGFTTSALPEQLQEQLQQQRQQQGLTLDWLQDVYWHVASCSHNLSVADLIAFLEAAQKLGGLTPTAVAQLLQEPADVDGYSSSDDVLSSRTTSALQQAVQQATPYEAARVLTVLHNMGMTLPTSTLSCMAETVHRGAANLPALLLLDAYQAAVLMSYDMAVTWLEEAFDKASEQLAEQTPAQLVSILSAVSQCCAHMPTIQLQYQWQNQIGLPSNGSTNQRAVRAYQAARALVSAACTQLRPALSQLQVPELNQLASALQQVQFTVMFPDAVARVTVGTGAGVHGQTMVNSFPVTVIAPPSVDVETAQASLGGPQLAVEADWMGRAAVQSPAELAGMLPVADARSTSSTGVGSSTSPAADGPESAFLRSLHDTYLARLDAFTSADELADVVRSLAAIRSLPSQQQLLQLSQLLEASCCHPTHAGDIQQRQPAQDVPTQHSHEMSQEMSPHAMCMALFLFSMLSHPISPSALQAAQDRLIPVMHQLSAADLTNAVWAFACLGGTAEPAATVSGTAPFAHAEKSTITHVSAEGVASVSVTKLQAQTGSSTRATQEASRSAAETSAAAATVTTDGATGTGSSSVNSGSITDSSRLQGNAWPSGHSRSIKTHTLADIAAANTANAGVRAQQAAVAAVEAANQTSANQRVVLDAVDAADQPQWLQPAVDAVLQQLDQFVPYQIAFMVASLERSRAQLSAEVLDQLLDAFQMQLHVANTGDVVLLLASVARLGHVTSYEWMDTVVESWAAPRLHEFSPKMLATVAWSLAKLHHRPSDTFLTALVDAAELQMSAFTVDNMATLVWAVSELDSDAPVTHFLDALCEEAGPRLTEFNPRDLVALLAAMARLKYQPSPQWMVEWLQAISPNLSYLEPQAFPQIVTALSAMDARITSSQWWARLMALSSTQLQLMDAEALLSLAAGLTTILDTDPPHTWCLAFSQAIEKMCIQAMPGSPWGQQAGTTPSTVGGVRTEVETGMTSLGLSLNKLGTHVDGIWTPPSSGNSSTLTAVQHELLLALQLKLSIPPGPHQMAHLELQLAGFSALRSLGPDRLVRLVGSLAAVAAAWGGSARMPRAAWLGGPLCEALRAALPDMALVQQSQLAKSLGELVSALDARHSGSAQPKPPQASNRQNPFQQQRPASSSVWDVEGGWEGVDGSVMPHSWADAEEPQGFGPFASPTQPTNNDRLHESNAGQAVGNESEGVVASNRIESRHAEGTEGRKPNEPSMQPSTPSKAGTQSCKPLESRDGGVGCSESEGSGSSTSRSDIADTVVSSSSVAAGNTDRSGEAERVSGNSIDSRSGSMLLGSGHAEEQHQRSGSQHVSSDSSSKDVNTNSNSSSSANSDNQERDSSNSSFVGDSIEAAELQRSRGVATEVPERAPASLRNLLAYLREFYLYN